MSPNLSPNESKPGRPVWWWLALAVSVLLVVALLWLPPVQRIVDEATHWAEGAISEHPIAGAVVFFGFSALSAMFAFASSVVLLPPATLAWGKALSFLLLWGGWIAGAALAYGVGRLLRPLLARSPFEAKLEKYQQYASQRMRFWALLLFCLAVPSEIPGYLLGSIRYAFPKFLAAMAIAEAAYALGAVIAGESLLRDQPLPILVSFGVLALLAAVAGLLLRGMKKRRAA
jgi:uncharacterized membrane protein YdjX (TVP38/TMEM64 family)